MEEKAQQIFYALCIFLLFTAFFILHPTKLPAVAQFQNQIINEFSIAAQQTLGDEPYFETVYEVIDSVSEFYQQAASETIALFEDKYGSDEDLAFIFNQVYQDFAASMHKAKTLAVTEPPIDTAHFMTQKALPNIVPEESAVSTVVSGIFTSSVEPVNKNNSWVTIQDNFTGQLYCLAVYNGEVNKYLGECRYDYH